MKPKNALDAKTICQTPATLLEAGCIAVASCEWLGPSSQAKCSHEPEYNSDIFGAVNNCKTAYVNKDDCKWNQYFLKAAGVTCFEDGGTTSIGSMTTGETPETCS